MPLGAAPRSARAAHAFASRRAHTPLKTLPRSTPSHAFLWTCATKDPYRGVARGLRDCADWCPGPLPPYIGDCRGRQKVAAGSQSDQYLDNLYESTRGYDHDLPRILSKTTSRSMHTVRSFTIFTTRRPLAANAFAGPESLRQTTGYLDPKALRCMEPPFRLNSNKTTNANRLLGLTSCPLFGSQ